MRDLSMLLGKYESSLSQPYHWPSELPESKQQTLEKIDRLLLNFLCHFLQSLQSSLDENNIQVELTLRRFFEFRWKLIRKTSLDYTFNPHLPMNQFCVELATEISRMHEEEPITLILMPTVKGILPNANSPEKIYETERDLDDAFDRTRFLTHMDGNNLIDLEMVFELITHNLELLFSSTTNTKTEIKLSAVDRKNIRAINPFYFDFLEKIYLLKSQKKPSIGWALEQVKDGLLASSTAGDGAEFQANFLECQDPIYAFYCHWQRLSPEIQANIAKSKAPHPELLGNDEPANLESYLLCLFARASDDKISMTITDDQQRRVIEEAIFPCTHQIGNELEVLLNRNPQLFSIPIPGREGEFNQIEEELALMQRLETAERALITREAMIGDEVEPLPEESVLIQQLETAGRALIAWQAMRGFEAELVLKEEVLTQRLAAAQKALISRNALLGFEDDRIIVSEEIIALLMKAEFAIKYETSLLLTIANAMRTPEEVVFVLDFLAEEQWHTFFILLIERNPSFFDLHEDHLLEIYKKAFNYFPVEKWRSFCDAFTILHHHVGLKSGHFLEGIDLARLLNCISVTQWGRLKYALLGSLSAILSHPDDVIYLLRILPPDTNVEIQKLFGFYIRHVLLQKNALMDIFLISPPECILRVLFFAHSIIRDNIHGNNIIFDGFDYLDSNVQYQVIEAFLIYANASDITPYLVKVIFDLLRPIELSHIKSSDLAKKFSLIEWDVEFVADLFNLFPEEEWGSICSVFSQEITKTIRNKNALFEMMCHVEESRWKSLTGIYRNTFEECDWSVSFFDEAKQVIVKNPLFFLEAILPYLKLTPPILGNLLAAFPENEWKNAVDIIRKNHCSFNLLYRTASDISVLFNAFKPLQWPELYIAFEEIILRVLYDATAIGIASKSIVKENMPMFFKSINPVIIKCAENLDAWNDIISHSLADKIGDCVKGLIPFFSEKLRLENISDTVMKVDPDQRMKLLSLFDQATIERAIQKEFETRDCVTELSFWQDLARRNPEKLTLFFKENIFAFGILISRVISQDHWDDFIHLFDVRFIADIAKKNYLRDIIAMLSEDQRLAFLHGAKPYLHHWIKADPHPAILANVLSLLPIDDLHSFFMEVIPEELLAYFFSSPLDIVLFLARMKPDVWSMVSVYCQFAINDLLKTSSGWLMLYMHFPKEQWGKLSLAILDNVASFFQDFSVLDSFLKELPKSDWLGFLNATFDLYETIVWNPSHIAQVLTHLPIESWKNFFILLNAFQLSKTIHTVSQLSEFLSHLEKESRSEALNAMLHVALLIDVKPMDIYRLLLTFPEDSRNIIRLFREKLPFLLLQMTHAFQMNKSFDIPVSQEMKNVFSLLAQMSFSVLLSEEFIFSDAQLVIKIMLDKSEDALKINNFKRDLLKIENDVCQGEIASAQGNYLRLKLLDEVMKEGYADGELLDLFRQQVTKILGVDFAACMLAYCQSSVSVLSSQPSQPCLSVMQRGDPRIFARPAMCSSVTQTETYGQAQEAYLEL